MTSKEKIRQYIDSKGITMYEFEKKTGISYGTMSKGKDFGVDKLKQIRDNFNDLNMNWLLFDEGNMLLTVVNEVNEHQESYQKESGAVEMLKKEVESLKSLLEAKNETIAVLKHQIGINSSENKQSKAS